MFKIAYFILQYPNEETDVYVLAPAWWWCTIDIDREDFEKNYIQDPKNSWKCYKK